MKDTLFLLSDLWLMATTWTYGFKMWRNYRNQLLTLEWLVVAVSSTNFLLWALLGGDKSSPMYDLAYALDAFSRSFGITLILVIGLLSVTHGYKPPAWVKLGATGLALAGALILGRMHSDHLVHDFPHVALAVFYVVTNLLTTAFLAYFTMRLWRAGLTRIALLTGVVTAAATYVAVTYDFFPFDFDDADRTIFYTIALSTWGAQAITYYYAYKAMREHNAATPAGAPRPIGATS